jgi:hypothetical protein
MGIVQHTGASNESSNTLQDVPTAANKSFKSGFSMGGSGTSGPSSLTGTKIKANLSSLKPIANSVNKKLGTPNSKSKNELKNFIFQPHNNYTKNFMKKKSIDVVTIQAKDSKSTSKERITGNNISLSLSNKGNLNNNNMNINVGNVNINLNNKMSNLTTINAYTSKRIEDRKLSILDIAGDGPLIDIESLIVAGQENMKKTNEQSKILFFLFLIKI